MSCFPQLSVLVSLAVVLAQSVFAADKPFVIRVIDDQTGRGVPLVELKTVNSVSWWTDSAGLIAFVLYNLIGLFTNLAFYHVWSFRFRSPEGTPLGPWLIVIPVVGGLIIGLMAKYGSDKI